MITAKEMRDELGVVDLEPILADIEDQAIARAREGYTDLEYINKELLYPEDISEQRNSYRLTLLIDQLRVLGYSLRYPETFFKTPYSDSSVSEYRLTIGWEK